MLKPGGKVAAIVMSTAEKNPYQGLLLPIVQRSGSTAGRIFSLGEPGALEKAYKDGGFPDVDVHTVSLPRRFSSSTEVIESLKDEISKA